MSQSQQNPFTEPAATGSTTNNNTTGADSSISNAGAASGITPAPAAAASGGGGYGAVGGSSHGGVPSGSSSEDAAYARPDPERDGPGANYREKPTTTGGGDELESKAPVADGTFSFYAYVTSHIAMTKKKKTLNASSAYILCIV